MRILVSGAFGWTAKAIIEALVADGHEVVGLDLPNVQSYVDTALFEKIYQGTVSDYDVVRSAISGCDAVVHLAVALGDVYQTPRIPFNVNVRGMANIMSASHEIGVDRVILMSSAPAHVAYEGTISAVNDCLQNTGGDFLYDLTKCLQEDVGRYFASTFGMRVITLRAGHIVDGQELVDPKGRSLDDVHYLRGGWVCRYDLAQSVMLALDYDKTGYNAFHIVGSHEAKLRFDLERTETVLGFVPEVHFEDYPLE